VICYLWFLSWLNALAFIIQVTHTGFACSSQFPIHSKVTGYRTWGPGPCPSCPTSSTPLSSSPPGPCFFSPLIRPQKNSWNVLTKMHVCNCCGFDLRRWNSRFKYEYNTSKLWISIHFRRSKVLFGYVWLATFNPKSISNWFCERTLFILIHCGFRFFWRKSTEYLEWTPLCWNLSCFLNRILFSESFLESVIYFFAIFNVCHELHSFEIRSCILELRTYFGWHMFEKTCKPCDLKHVRKSKTQYIKFKWM